MIKYLIEWLFERYVNFEFYKTLEDEAGRYITFERYVNFEFYKTFLFEK